MTLYVMQCHPDPVAFAAFAERNRLIGPGGDTGYAVHALLTAAFASQAPKPFRFFENRKGLLAYSQVPPEALQEAAELAPPDVHRALGLASLQSRAMPDAWQPGRVLGFEVRVRPVIRTRDDSGRVRERDAFLYALDRQRSEEASPDRGEVHASWLQAALAGDGARTTDKAVSLLECRTASARRTRVLRRTQADEGSRQTRWIEGPDVTFEGVLRIEQPQAFAALLARGVGRHRAFGFGMLLLRPA